jgi:hypothetical protein
MMIRVSFLGYMHQPSVLLLRPRTTDYCAKSTAIGIIFYQC